MKFTEKLLSRNLLNKNKSVQIGNTGEDYAARMLKKSGYKIIDRNYASRFGEIDIIAKDGEYTCFVEVRLRKSTDYGSPEETIDYFKQRRIIKTAQMYAVKNKLYNSPLRFDAVLLRGETEMGKTKILSGELIKNAFTL